MQYKREAHVFSASQSGARERRQVLPVHKRPHIGSEDPAPVSIWRLLSSGHWTWETLQARRCGAIEQRE
jgi:hypothetical protein